MESGQPLSWWLDGIDKGLQAVAVLGVLVIFFRFSKGRPKYPISSATYRTTPIREDHIAVVVLIYFGCQAVLLGMAQLMGWSLDAVDVNAGIHMTAQLVGIGACLNVASRSFPDGSMGFMGTQKRFGLFKIAKVTLAVTILSLGLCPLVLEGTIGLIQWFQPTYAFSLHRTLEALHDPAIATQTIVLLWVAAAGLTPVAEEVFFRGLLQSYLVDRLANPWLAILVSSMVFGLVHVQQAYAVPALMVFGMLLGYAYERSGSLLSPIIIHIIFNLKTLLWDQWASQA